MNRVFRIRNDDMFKYEVSYLFKYFNIFISQISLIYLVELFCISRVRDVTVRFHIRMILYINNEQILDRLWWLYNDYFIVTFDLFSSQSDIS